MKASPQAPLSFDYFSSAIVCNMISAAGTFALAGMMVQKNLHQNWYLAAVYFFLHFQFYRLVYLFDPWTTYGSAGAQGNYTGSGPYGVPDLTANGGPSLPFIDALGPFAHVDLYNCSFCRNAAIRGMVVVVSSTLPATAEAERRFPGGHAVARLDDCFSPDPEVPLTGLIHDTGFRAICIWHTTCCDCLSASGIIGCSYRISAGLRVSSKSYRAHPSGACGDTRFRSGDNHK